MYTFSSRTLLLLLPRPDRSLGNIVESIKLPVRSPLLLNAQRRRIVQGVKAQICTCGRGSAEKLRWEVLRLVNLYFWEEGGEIGRSEYYERVGSEDGILKGS